ncbi:MAG: M2 family metallopeptidase, partial [Polyangiaceae bacterium]
MKRSSLRFLAPLVFLSLPLVACDEKKEPAAAPAADAAVASAPTVEDAQKFMTQVDKDLRRLWVARDRAMWVNENFITDDTEALGAAGEEATAEYITRTIKEAQKFAGLKLPDDLARQFLLLKLAQTVPAPTDAKEREELAGIEVAMMGSYGKGKYCPPRLNGKCLTLGELSKTMAESRKYDELLDAWTGWHSTSPVIKDKYARYVELGNKGAKEIGFDDMGALWRAGYDMPPADFEKDIERLWQQVKPLYDDLHCFVRGKLQEKYGKDKVADGAPIPAHLLGNMWAQEWNNIYDIVEPYKGQPSLDVSKKLREKKYDSVKMTKLGESFFTSLGFDPLPATFWERSLFNKPRDREVVCHASAWDPSWNNDLRVKVCLEPTEEDLITIHHELGHDFYFHQYTKLPVL